MRPAQAFCLRIRIGAVDSPEVSTSEPLTPIRHPPTQHADGNRGCQRPPERQGEVG